MNVFCDVLRWYAEIPRGTNQVERVFQGNGQYMPANPAYRRIIEIPDGVVVTPGDSYDSGVFIPQRTSQDKAIEVGGAARRQRGVERLVKHNPVEALLMKEGLK